MRKCKPNCKDCGILKTVENTCVRRSKGYFNSYCKECANNRAKIRLDLNGKSEKKLVPIDPDRFCSPEYFKSLADPDSLRNRCAV